MGIVNACSLAECHADSTLQALEKITNEWYGELKPRKLVIAAQAGILGPLDRVTAAADLLGSEAPNPMAQVTALGYFLKQYLEPNMGRLEPSIVEALERLAEDEDLDVRSVALATLHFALGDVQETRRFLSDELKSLGALDHAVRGRWVIAMQLYGDGFLEQREYRTAITVYKKALEVLPRHPGVLYGLGYTYDLLGDFASAVEYYEQSLAADPTQTDVQADLEIARENLTRARGG